jgi:hypothetical protein
MDVNLRAPRGEHIYLFISRGIGRIFAYWAFFYFRQLFKIKRFSSNFWATFVHGKSYVLILTKNCLGFILGDFFTNLSGHPV